MKLTIPKDGDLHIEGTPEEIILFTTEACKASAQAAISEMFSAVQYLILDNDGQGNYG